MTSAQETRPRRRLGLGKILLALALLLIVATVVGLAAWQRHAAARVEQQLALIRAAGDPISPEEMAAYYRLPDGVDDCTQLYLDACAALDGQQYYAAAAAGVPFVDGGIEDIPDPPPPGQDWPGLAAASNFLRTYQASLDQLHEAGHRGGAARYPVDFSQGNNMPLPQITLPRRAARLLQLEAIVRAHEGDSHGTAEAILAQWCVGESFANDPFLVSQLLRIIVSSTAIHQTQDLIGAIDFSDDDLRMLQAAFREYDAATTSRRVLRGERWYGFDALVYPIGDDLHGQSKLLDRLFVEAYKAHFLEHLARLIRAADGPMPQASRDTAAIDADFKAKSKPGWLDQFHTNHAQESMSMYAVTVDACFRVQARAIAADTALAAELYRRRHGNLPVRLEDLTPDFLPAVPVDRFTGLPMRMVTQADELLIYSIGPDNVDNGGVVSGNPSQPSDEVFVLKAKGGRRP